MRIAQEERRQAEAENLRKIAAGIAESGRRISEAMRPFQESMQRAATAFRPLYENTRRIADLMGPAQKALSQATEGSRLAHAALQSIRLPVIPNIPEIYSSFPSQELQRALQSMQILNTSQVVRSDK